MSPEQREQLEKQFGHLDRAQLKYRISKNDGIDASQARLWMEVLDEEERQAATLRANESLELARKAAQAAERAAVAAEDSAKYTRAAAWASAIAAIVALAVAVLAR